MAPWYAWTPWGGEFWVARLLFQRGLALSYLVAFLVAARQFRPLAGDEATLSLLRTNPFPDAPPRHVRALRYRYEFTDLDTYRETGRWWSRERVGTYYGPVSLDDSRFRLTLRRRGWDLPDEDPETGEATVPMAGE